MCSHSNCDFRRFSSSLPWIGIGTQAPPAPVHARLVYTPRAPVHARLVYTPHASVHARPIYTPPVPVHARPVYKQLVSSVTNYCTTRQQVVLHESHINSTLKPVLNWANI